MEKRTYNYRLAFSSMPGNEPRWDGEQTFVHKPFSRMFADAALLAFHSREANKDTPWAIRMACARASILGSAFTLEAAANCCLGRLDVPGKTSKELDYLATLGKFDVFLIACGARSLLDRGSKHVQAMADLIDLRNTAVHPKHTTRKRMHGPKVTRSGEDIKHTDFLNIPLEHIFWTPDDAETVLRALCDFLNYFLLGLCKLSVPQSEAVLCTEWHDSKGDCYIATQEFGGDLFMVESEWKLDLRFLHTWKMSTHCNKDGSETIILPAYPKNREHHIPREEVDRRRKELRKSKPEPSPAPYSSPASGSESGEA